jgi:hypothetical protein
MEGVQIQIPVIAHSDYTKTSRVIHRGPCIVKTVHMAADGANADCQVYDGESTNGDLKAHIEALSGTSASWKPGDGTDFDKGIYIEVNAATTKVTITFITESWKHFI